MVFNGQPKLGKKSKNDVTVKTITSKKKEKQRDTDGGSGGRKL